MNYSPKDILNYVIENEKEADFLVSNALHKMGYSIAEITDARFVRHEEGYYLRSKAYDVNVLIQTEDIVASLDEGHYVSAFISRDNKNYQVSFLVHPFSKDEVDNNAEEIAKTVVKFMIFNTIRTLRLDTPEKVDNYISN